MSIDVAEPGLHAPGPHPAETDRVVLDVVVPVYNEETDLEPSVRRLHAHLADALPVPVPDHHRRQRQHRRHPGRSRGRLAAELPDVARGPARGEGPRPGAARRSGRPRTRRCSPTGRRPVHRPRRAAAAGRAADLRALGPGDRHPARPRRRGWSAGPSGSSSRAATTCCCAARWPTGFSDAQCGFKAIRADVAQRLLPLVEDTGWFFDTELLVLAERGGPAHPRGAGGLGRRPATAGSTSSPPPSPTCRASGAARARPGRRARCRSPSCAPSSAAPRWPPTVPGVPTAMPRQLVRFAAIGVASTLAYLLLYLLLRGVMGAIAANVVALLVTAVANTAANRRLTFGVRGRERRRRPPAPGPARVRARAGPDHRRAGRCSGTSCPTRAGPSSWPCSSSPTPPPPCCGSCSSAPGSSARAPHSPRRPSSPRRSRHDRHPERLRRARTVPTAAAPSGRGGELPCARRAAGRHGGALPVDLAASGWANSFYAAAVQAGDAELEGVLLRLARRRQRDHRRQAARLAVGDGRCPRGSSASPRGACWSRRR